MAEVVRYVDPDASGSANGESWTNAYTSLSAWESAEQTNLVTDGDWHHCYVRASSGTADTTQCTIDGWTTGASNYILIEAASGDEAQAGAWSTSRYRLSVTDGGAALIISEDYVRVKGIQVEHTYSSQTYTQGIRANPGATSAILIDSCRVQPANTGGERYGIDARTGTVTIQNNIVDGDFYHGINLSGGTTYVYNNTVTGGTSRGMSTGNSADGTYRNNIVTSTANDFGGFGTQSIDYNASDDGDGTNAVTITAIDDLLEDLTNGDFTPIASSDIDGAGIAISGLTLDMAGETWADPPTIGVLEITSSGVALTPEVQTTGSVEATISSSVTLVPEVEGASNVEAVVTHTVSFLPEVEGIADVEVILDSIQTVSPTSIGLGEVEVVLGHSVSLAPTVSGTGNVDLSFEFNVSLELEVSGIGIVTYLAAGNPHITRSLFAGLFRKFLEKDNG